MNKWKKRRLCLHQEMPKFTFDNTEDKVIGITRSYLKSTLIDIGMKKMIWCEECGKTWII
jgi:hypothetical protein